MNTPTPNALRAAKKIWPSGGHNVSYCYADPDERDAAILRDQTHFALEIDAATGLPELLSALKAALRHSLDAMPRAQRAMFNNPGGEQYGPEWMFIARAALEKGQQ